MKKILIILISCLALHACSSLAMESSLDEFRKDLITLAKISKESRYFVPTVEKEMTWKEWLITAKVENGGEIILSYFTSKKELIGEMSVNFPGNDFWYGFKFPKQDITIDRHFSFYVFKNKQLK